MQTPGFKQGPHPITDSTARWPCVDTTATGSSCPGRFRAAHGQRRAAGGGEGCILATPAADMEVSPPSSDTTICLFGGHYGSAGTPSPLPCLWRRNKPTHVPATQETMCVVVLLKASGRQQMCYAALANGHDCASCQCAADKGAVART